MKKAFGYLRVSTPGQVDRDGFPRQVAAIEKYAKARGLKIERYFEEKGVSGTLADRPAWQGLMVALLADGVRVVVVEKLDRLARDLMVQETLIGDLRKNGFELVSANEPDLCSDDPSRKLIRQIFGSIAEYDRCMIVAKLKAARDRRSKAAGCRIEGRKRIGRHPEEQVALQRMRELRNQGQSFNAIAATLNSEGVRTHKPEGKWYAAGVQRILTRH